MVSIIAAFAAGGAVTLLIVLLHPQCGGFAYLNLAYACGGEPVVAKGEYTSLHTDLASSIADAQSQGVGTTSVYFRDLNDGPVFSINGDTLFAPGSLLKLPIVIGALAIEESQPGLLSATAPYAASSIGSTSVPAGIEVPANAPGFMPGSAYSMMDYARATIADSDNLSYYILLNYLNNDVPGAAAQIEGTFEDLGVVDPRTPQEQVVDAHGYASLLRILYNASYLNKTNSNELLSWMAASTFDDGLVAGVPSGITVADKWGVRDLPDGTEQLHDCGIVYYPQNPYVLCVMTSGTDDKQLAALIASISRQTYEAVNSRHD